MKEGQWVQHMSGKGQKWEVDRDFDAYCWQVRDKTYYEHSLFVPKNEYRPCEPPEKWVDVTDECRFQDGWETLCHNKGDGNGDRRLFPTQITHSYRLRKVALFDGKDIRSAFIVERKVQ